MGVFEDWRLGYTCEAFAYCLLFITELTSNCLSSDMGISFVEAIVYGLKWAHSMAGLVSCPVSHLLVKSALGDAKMKLARPVRPKEPLSVDTVQAKANFYSSDVCLAVLNFLSIFLVGFYGFFRIDEINSFCLHDIIVISKIQRVD